MKTLHWVAGAMLVSMASICSGATFTFETVPSGTNMPFSTTDSGLTATLSGGGAACNTTLLGFVMQSGISAITGYCGSPSGSTTEIDIAFSQPLSSVSLNFALVTVDTFTLTAFQGATPVGSASSPGTLIPTHPFLEGSLTFDAANFDNIKLTTTVSQISIDNVNATPAPSTVPEPNSLALVGLPMFGGGMLALFPIIRRSRRASKRAYGV